MGVNRTGELSGALVQIDIGLLADEVGVAATDTLDLGEGVDNLLLAVDVGVEQTQDELEVRLEEQQSLASQMKLRPSIWPDGVSRIYLLARHERHAGQPG